MTDRTRRDVVAAAVTAPVLARLGLPAAAWAASGPSGVLADPRQVARDWFAALAAGRLDPRTHPGIVLVLHGAGAGLDGTPERFEGREAVAAVLAGAGPARWTVEEALGQGESVALRGTVRFGDGPGGSFAAFLGLRDGQVARVERYLDRVARRGGNGVAWRVA